MTSPPNSSPWPVNLGDSMSLILFKPLTPSPLPTPLLWARAPHLSPGLLQWLLNLPSSYFNLFSTLPVLGQIHKKCKPNPSQNHAKAAPCVQGEAEIPDMAKKAFHMLTYQLQLLPHLVHSLYDRPLVSWGPTSPLLSLCFVQAIPSSWNLPLL